MRLFSALLAGLASAFLATLALAQPTGSQRVYFTGASQFYLERPSLTDGASAINYTWNSTSGGGVWEITSLGGGLYSLISGGKALTCDSTVEWTVVKTAAYTGADSQKWEIIQNTDGSWRIINSGKALTGQAGSGGFVKIATHSGWSTQKWRFTTEDKTAWPAGSWQWVYRSVTLSTSLLVNKSNTLVIDSTIQGVVNATGATNALTVKAADNVYLQNTRILDAYTNHGLYIEDSSNVTVDGCSLDNHVRPATSHSSFLFIDSSPNVTVRATTIRNADGNGVFTIGSATTGLVIEDCTIENTGRVTFTYSTGPAPFHGIYSKAPDVTYTGNTITNALDGSAISMRSTGVLIGNILSDAKHSLIAYWPDAPAGPSGSLFVFGNILTQTNCDYSGGTSKAAIIGINDNNNPTNAVGAYFDVFRVQNNSMRVTAGSDSADALITANLPYGNLNYKDMRVTGNTMKDERATKAYFTNAARFQATTPNTLQ